MMVIKYIVPFNLGCFMRHDNPSMTDLVTAMDPAPGVSTFYSEREIQPAERFSVSFTLEPTHVGFRALGLLAWACSEMADAQRGRVEVKAFYSHTPFTEGEILCFELCGTGEPRHIAACIRGMSRILILVRGSRLHVAGK
jgi:hypothetical protein